MAVEYASKGLIGVLTPQANTTVEPEFWIMLPPGVAMINARMTSDKSSLEARLVDYFDQMDRAVEQFANAPLQPALARQPVLTRDGRLERPHLEVLFDVDGEEVRCG